MRSFAGALLLAAAVLTACVADEPEPDPAPSPTSAAASTPAQTSTALVEAAERGDAALVGRLLRAGAAVDEVDGAGRTALEAAVTSGAAIDTVRVLVARGADASRVTGAAQYAVLTAVQQPPPADPAAALLAAAAAGDADGAAVALRAGADLETRDGHQRTALLLAAADDRLDVARLLVALGADPDALDDRHDTPWLVTGVTGSVPMLEALLPAGPDLTIRNRFGGVSVIPAAERGHVDYVRRVVTTGIDVNHVNDPGWTALLEAVVHGDGSAPYQEIVRILLAAGADPAIRDATGRTALQHAEVRGQTAVAEILRSR
ncbi:MAG TPA: ankyrin repeat domain-containing protein [Blastococcus sp.]|nr:ankyrin repeat domain-containing protein [Blastococcus sp.]